MTGCLCSDLDHVASASSERTSDQWQCTAYEHDSSDDVDWRHVIGVSSCAKTCDQYRANNGTRAPCRKHRAVNRPRVLWPKEVGGEGRHRAKPASIAQPNDGCRDE